MPDYSGIGAGKDRWIHEQVADVLEGAIRAGEYQPGKPLPSWKHIAQDAGVSQHTVANAIRLLISRGLVQTRDRLGTFVTERTSD